MIFALLGNQNSGKTTLFNQLTGSNQHVGNFPGVTVDKKEGVLRGYKDITVVDLPGIYSLSPYSSEETVTRDFLFDARPDCIINILDATNIERNLYLSLQLLQLNIPIVMALNMMDEVRKNGGTIKTDMLEKSLGIPVIPISASKNEGVDELIKTAVHIATNKIRPPKQDFCEGAVHRTLHAVAHTVEDHAIRLEMSPMFCATKIIEGDNPLLTKLALSENEIELIEHSVEEMANETSLDRKAAIADMRYKFIEKVCKSAVIKPTHNKKQEQSRKIDNILTNKYLAIPIFILIMFLIFILTFGVIGNFLSSYLEKGITYLSGVTEKGLTSYGINPVIKSLVIDGIFAGIGSILSFIPTIIILFFFLSLLEDSGYMARIAFVMDKLLRKIGLSGKSIVPLLIGFGCSVPAVMATRTLSSERDRKMTVFLIPFMSCSAKLPIYAFFTDKLFPVKYKALVMLGLYLFGMIMAVVTALIAKKTLFKGNPVPFVMELPNYRFPTAKNTFMLLWEKTKDFITRAFTVIFIASIVVWYLQSFDLKLNYIADASQTKSLLQYLGQLIIPVFKPLGFGDWRIATSLICGFMAKEAVVSSLEILGDVKTMFTTLSALSFLVFCLLYTPCIAAVNVIRKELGGVWKMFAVIAFQTGVAWIAGCLVYQIGALLA